MSDEPELVPHPMLNPGAWCDRTRVTLGHEAVTIEFMMLDPIDAGTATLVAQLVLPPAAAFELRDDLIQAMAEYTGRGRSPLED